MLLNRCWPSFILRVLERSHRPPERLNTVRPDEDQDRDLQGCVSELKALLRRKDRQIKLLVSELDMVESRERSHLSQLLHDQIGQLLVVSRLKLRKLAQSLPLNSPEERAVSELTELNEQSIYEIRSLAPRINRAAFVEKDLRAIIDELRVEILALYGLQTTVESSGKRFRVDIAESIMLYYAVRELLINVAKHAEAASTTVRIEQSQEMTKVEVIDDGVGIMAGQHDRLGTRSGTSLGLSGVQDRIEAYGGAMQIVTAQERGTQITLSLPRVQASTEERS